MGQYRKKPVVIEAIQLTTNNLKEVYEFIHGKGCVDNSSCQMAEDRWGDYERIVNEEGLRLKTLESHNETQIASVGDFIIKGVKGEFYPCKPDVFDMTYEEVK
jgi:hypothetical protein